MPGREPVMSMPLPPPPAPPPPPPLPTSAGYTIDIIPRNALEREAKKISPPGPRPNPLDPTSVCLNETPPGTGREHSNDTYDCCREGGARLGLGNMSRG
jgi:hypothetical protein